MPKTAVLEAEHLDVRLRVTSCGNSKEKVLSNG